MQWATIRSPSGLRLRVQYLRHLPPCRGQGPHTADNLPPPDFAPYVRDSNGDLVGAFGSEVCLAPSAGSGAGGGLSRAASVAMGEDSRTSDDFAAASRSSSDAHTKDGSMRRGSAGAQAPATADGPPSPSGAAGSQAPSPRHWRQQHSRQRQHQPEHADKRQPERQRLLIIANPGTADGAGGATHLIGILHDCC